MDDLEPNPELSDLTPATESGPPAMFTWLALLAAGVAMLVGIVGLLIARSATSELKQLRTEMEATPDETPELRSAIEEVDERLVKLGGEFVKLNRQDRQIRDDTQGAFDSVTKELQENRKQINLITEQLTEITSRVDQGVTARPSRTESADPTSSTPAEETPEDGVYRIQSGDTMSGIAQRFGVSLSDLMNANPGVNPRGLQIGQRIIIP